MSIRVQLARLKRRMLKKPFLKDKKYPAYWFDQLLSGQVAFIVQIGSNDGKTGDPLNQLLNKHNQWKALFVEPVPYLFKRLQNNYSDESRFCCENVAINDGSKLQFYWVDPKAKSELEDLPFWFDQLGSFNKQHIVSQLEKRIEPYILSKELEGITLSTLLARNKVSQIDLLHIDTEGYDWKILSQLDLDRYTPKFILFEMNHLSEKELKEAYNFLTIKYELFHVGIDVLAVNRKIGEVVIEKMSQQMKKLNI